MTQIVIILITILINFQIIFRIEVQKDPHTTSSFCLTSLKLLINPQNILQFSFKAFATLLLIFKAIPSHRLELLNLSQDHP